MSLLLIILLGFGAVVFLACIVALLFFLIKSSAERNGEMGINLSPTQCPKCATPVPVIRRPANMRQALYGGSTCKNCGTEVDKWGKPV
jgi:hypothetical protein